ncbi:hypothetical protein ACWCW7_29680 [Nocardia tengchongensis]
MRRTSAAFDLTDDDLDERPPTVWPRRDRTASDHTPVFVIDSITSIRDLRAAVTGLLAAHPDLSFTTSELVAALPLAEFMRSIDRVSLVGWVLQEMSGRVDGEVLRIGFDRYQTATPTPAVRETQDRILELVKARQLAGIATPTEIGQVLIRHGWDAPADWPVLVLAAMDNLVADDNGVPKFLGHCYEFAPHRPFSRRAARTPARRVFPDGVYALASSDHKNSAEKGHQA